MEREIIKLTREVLSCIASLCTGSKVKHEGITYKVKKHDIDELEPVNHKVIFRRETDGKYFRFKCLVEGPYTGVDEDYNFDTDFPNEAVEVLPKIIFE